MRGTLLGAGNEAFNAMVSFPALISNETTRMIQPSFALSFSIMWIPVTKMENFINICAN